MAIVQPNQGKGTYNYNSLIMATPNAPIEKPNQGKGTYHCNESLLMATPNAPIEKPNQGKGTYHCNESLIMATPNASIEKPNQGNGTYHCNSFIMATPNVGIEKPNQGKGTYRCNSLIMAHPIPLLKLLHTGCSQSIIAHKNVLVTHPVFLNPCTIGLATCGHRNEQVWFQHRCLLKNKLSNYGISQLAVGMI